MKSEHLTKYKFKFKHDRKTFSEGHDRIATIVYQPVKYKDTTEKQNGIIFRVEATDSRREVKSGELCYLNTDGLSKEDVDTICSTWDPSVPLNIWCHLNNIVIPDALWSNIGLTMVNSVTGPIFDLNFKITKRKKTIKHKRGRPKKNAPILKREVQSTGSKGPTDNVRPVQGYVSVSSETAEKRINDYLRRRNERRLNKKGS